MSINPRAARALRDARTRLRDIAAADHANTASARQRAAERVVHEREIHAGKLAAAATDLGGARNVYHLTLVADLLAEQAGVIADVAKQHDAASVTADRAADRLRDRTRQLRTAEKLVEMAKHERDTHDARTEQRTTDDLVAARSR